MREDSKPIKVDVEGYELRELPWWYSPLTKKQVHMDSYGVLSQWREVTETDIRSFLRERGFIGEEYLWLEGEFDRRELQERKGTFRVDPTRPTIIRKYIRRRYVPEEVLTYTIIEKLEYMQIELTFSIDTDVGHEIFEAEVHAETTFQVGMDETEIARRVVNAILKLFFIVFDGFKVVYVKKDVKDPDWLIRLLIYLQSHNFDPAYEKGPKEGMDGFLSIVMDRIKDKIAAYGPDYFLTRESFLSIGIEYGKAEFLYEYPNVHVLIEKTRRGRYTVERTVIIAPSTSIYMDDLLEMPIGYERKLK